MGERRRAGGRGALLVLVALVALVMCGCDEAPREKERRAARPQVSVSVQTDASGSPPREGCARGTLEGIDTDPACVLAQVAEDAMRDFSKRVTVELVPDAPVVPAGDQTLLRLTMKNVSSREMLVVFEGHPHAPGNRPDFARLVGVPEARPPNEAMPRLHFNVVTIGAYDQNVDGMPTIANSAPPASTPRLFGVRLAPGARLRHQITWYALRIPPPPPIVTDDAGHRFVTKTLAIPLLPGRYTASVELPLHGLAPAERTLSTKLEVEPVPDPVPKKKKPLPPALPPLPPPDYDP